jgi:hypothetical protein
MLTVSNLAQRQKQALNNIDEKFKQMRRVPVGGYGALIEKPNQTPIKQNVTPTLFNLTPMSSSLPYLADHSKFRSNINQLLMLEHIKIQKENLKATLDFDSVKIGEYEDRKIDNMIMQDIHAPNTKELMKRYLTGEIKHRQEDEVEKEMKRQQRVDAQLYETPPITHQHLPEMTRGDLGTIEPKRKDIVRTVLETMREQVFPDFTSSKPEEVKRNKLELKRPTDPLKKLNDQLFESMNKPEDPRRKELLKSAFDKLRSKSSPFSEMAKGLKEFQSGEITKELLRNEYRNKVELKRSIDELKRLNVELPQAGKLQNKPSKIAEIIKGRARGLIRLDIPSKSQREQRDYLTNEARLNGDNGGGLVNILKAN